MLVFWLALILMAYWWCFVREAPAGLRGYLGNVCEVFEISPRTAEIILKGANSYLMAGSVAAIIWLSLNKLFARIESEPEIKMVCCNCGGKIAFPGRAIGMNILCPHCANVLILRKP
jgi:predicted RNA-binding Zn-ribbon protein involved in translation (DUF1610 family)